MDLFFYGHDSDLQSVKRCIKHEDEVCTYYRRVPEQAFCYKCKMEIEKNVKDTTSGKNKDNGDPSKSGSRFGGVTASSSQNDPHKSTQMVAGERGKITRVDQYTEDLLKSVKEVYAEMISVYKENENDIAKRNKTFKIESQLIWGRLQKFMSSMLVDAQREMQKDMDFH